MKTYRFVPAEYKGDGKDESLKEFEGHVDLRIPTFDERMGYMQDIGVKFNDKGETEATSDFVGQVRKMVAVSESHYIAVALRHKLSDTSYKTFEDLSMDQTCDRVLTIVGGLIVRGLGPSKH